MDDFKLCFIYKVNDERDLMHYLEWIGPATWTQGEQETVAEFQMLNRKSLEPIDELQKHFKLH